MKRMNRGRPGLVVKDALVVAAKLDEHGLF